MFEIMFLEIYQSEIKIIWSRKLPGQIPPRAGSAPKLPFLDYEILGRISQ